MKDMKIAAKLIVGFLIVIILAVIVGGVGIFGMYNINAADDALYEENTIAIDAIGKILTNYQSQRVEIRNFILHDAEDAGFADAVAKMAQLEKEMETYWAIYEPTITEPEDEANFNEFKNLYTIDFENVTNEVEILGAANQNDDAMIVLSDFAKNSAVKIQEKLDFCSDLNKTAAKTAVDANTKLFTILTIILVAVLVLSIAISMAIALYISGLISKPMSRMKACMEQVAESGDVVLESSLLAQMERDALVRDEVGESISAFKKLFTRIAYVSDSLGHIADGDLTYDIAVLSEKDALGNAMTKTQDSLNSMFGEINTATEQVSTGSKQIADGSQALAQGSTQQAAAVEELSSSIAEIANKTKDNAQMAGKASSLSNKIKTNAEKGSDQMKQMMQAVKDINDASASIGKVIKVIDDIAFQTNILALNAAVEAARAGQHGKGFAVVAEEVRNLAAKSAAAAKDTGGLIANSIEKAELGSRIATETSESLNEIVTGINESAAIVDDIAKSSDEQSLAIGQINNGIDQVAQVVQQNSATAEESAAASEEMSSQSNMLQSLVAQFKTKGQSSMRASSARRPSSNSSSKPRMLAMPAKSSFDDSYSNDFGKY